MFPITATSTFTVVVPVPLNCKATGQVNSAQPVAARYCVDVAVEDDALLKIAELVVPEGENVFPVNVSVATRLLAFRSITLAAPDERLTTLKVRLEPEA